MLVQTQINSGAVNAQRYEEEADFFRLLEAPNPVSIRFYKNGREVADAPLVKAGYAEKFSSGFDAWRIESATTQTIQFVTRNGNQVQYDIAPTGVVSGNEGVNNMPAQTLSFIQDQWALSTGSIVIAPARATRRYLLVQNKSTTVTIWINLSGAVATQSNGIRLDPGDSYERDTPCPSQSVTATASAATNEIVVVEAG